MVVLEIQCLFWEVAAEYLDITQTSVGIRKIREWRNKKFALGNTFSVFDITINFYLLYANI